MTERMVTLEDGLGYHGLRCPRCGNHGEASFSAATSVLIGGDGVPFLAASYAEAPDPHVDCHGCDYEGPLAQFEYDEPTQRLDERG